MRVENTSDIYEKQQNNHITDGNANHRHKVVTKEYDKSTTNLTISKEAIEMLEKNLIEQELEKEKKKEMLKKMAEDMKRFKEMLEQSKETGKAASEGVKQLSRCIKIAMRIVQGDNVPTKDKQYLMEHNSELYSMAMNMRMYKKDPKDYESELDDEETKTNIKFSVSSSSIDNSISPQAESQELLGETSK